MRSTASEISRFAAVIDLPLEARLVLACARVAPGTRELDRVAALAHEPLDWDRALRLGLRHGLGPLMHRNLSRVAIPRPVAAALWAFAESVARRNRAMAAELVRIAAALDRAGIRFAPFKGPVLANDLYGDLTLREFTDLDILVAPQDVRAARNCLANRGYVARTPLDPAVEALWLESPGRHELPLLDGEGRIVELQWRANPDVAVPRLAEPSWWDTAPLTRFEGLRLRTLPADELMVALLVHGAKHAWASLDWLVDIAELARSGAVRWDLVTRLAADNGAARRIALGLELAHRLLEAPLPAPLLEQVARSADGRIVDGIVASIVAPEYVPPTPARVLRMELALCDSAARRISRALAWLRPTPGDWQSVRLPRPFFFAYWMVRPLRLAYKHGVTRRFPRIPPGATPRTPPPRPRSTG